MLVLRNFCETIIIEEGLESLITLYDSTDPIVSKVRAAVAHSTQTLPSSLKPTLTYGLNTLIATDPTSKDLQGISTFGGGVLMPNGIFYTPDEQYEQCHLIDPEAAPKVNIGGFTYIDPQYRRNGLASRLIQISGKLIRGYFNDQSIEITTDAVTPLGIRHAETLRKAANQTI